MRKESTQWKGSNLHKELNGESNDEKDSDKNWSHRVIPSWGITIPYFIVSPNESIQRIHNKDQRDWKEDESIKLCTTCDVESESRWWGLNRESNLLSLEVKARTPVEAEAKMTAIWSHFT
jgi:hypothetical protein